jgi:amino acid adenylation domain-containing protein
MNMTSGSREINLLPDERQRLCSDKLDDSYPLSHLQESMLFYSLYAPQSQMYIRQIIYSLVESLDVAALKKAWEGVIRRHPLLRSSLRWEGVSAPVQDVHANVDLPLRHEDWRAIPPIEREAHLEELLESERSRGFDLTQPPLMRLALFRLDEADYRLVWTFHHIISDGYSDVLILSETFALYDAMTGGEQPQLGEPGTYRQHCAWVRQKDFTDAEQFWRQKLSGFTTPTILSKSQKPDGITKWEEGRGELSIGLPQSLTSNLKSFARQHDLTLNTLLQGAWAILLSRYTGEEDVVFGAIRGGRRSVLGERSADRIVGPFINTVPVRIRINPKNDLLECLKQLRHQWVDMRNYEHTPLLLIQNWSGLPRGTPLFETIVSFDRRQMDTAMRSQNGRFLNRSMRSIQARTSYPLTLTGYGEDELLLVIHYDRQRFEEPDIDRMLGHLWRIFEGMVAGSERSLAKVSLLTESERHQLLDAWNNTDTDYPRHKCVHTLFEEQVECVPDSIAVSFSDASLTYYELNTRANQLGHYLRKLGAKPGQVVGVYLERSLELIISLLGVLKSGAAYVPLDSSYPAERLTFMLADTQAPVLLTQRCLSSGLLDDEVLRLCVEVCLDDEDEIAQQSQQNLGDTTTVDNLAYVIYTSGSTGKPKGVAARHCGLVNLINWHQKTYEVSQQDRASQIASFSFDASVWEIWPYLTAGASLHLAGEETRSNSSRLLQWIEAEAITNSFMATPLAVVALKESNSGGLSLKVLLTGGDKLGWIANKDLAFKLMNHYGPTEATVVTTFCAVEMGNVSESAPPIGRPIANAQIYVLDQYLEPVPTGIAGELYVSGEGLAAGYLNRAELTAERFVANPFSKQAGDRMYKTGDLVRYLSSGQADFISRIDHQVKVRGLRIELGEIEATLTQHPLVQEAVVVACEQSAGEKMLAAFIVMDGMAASTSQIRQWLKQKLPAYMIPSALIAVEKMPLMPNGKVDRRGLSAASQLKRQHIHARQLPRTPIEEVVAGIWCQLLKVEDVSVTENFFEMGGHSLMATQVVSRVREVLQVEVSVREVFEKPTIAEIAQHIEEVIRAGQQQMEPALVAMSRAGRSPLSFGQQRLWFLDQLEGGGNTYNIPIGIRMEGRLNLETLGQSFNQIIRRHEVLRTVFGSEDGEPVQLIQPYESRAVQLIDLSELSGEQRETVGRQITQEAGGREFDLAVGPVITATVVKEAESSHVLVISVHHIACDGWSVGVLMREMSRLYEDYISGRGSSLEELTIQYVDYALWQREKMRGEAAEKQLRYWRQKLEGAPEQMRVIEDRVRNVTKGRRGGIEEVELEEEVAAGLRQFSRREGVSLYMALLAAFKVLLKAYTGVSDIVIGTAIANRNRAEIEGMIGFFVNTMVLRTDLSGEPSFREVLRRIREVALGAYVHQEIPFEKLVEAIDPERSLSRMPLFQVMFVLQKEDAGNLQMRGIEASKLGIEIGADKFDLTLSIRECEQNISAVLHYNTELFDAVTIKRMLGHYVRLLKKASEWPEQRITESRMLSDREIHQLLKEWNATDSDYSKHECIHTLFERQVERTPEAIAVIYETESLTYAELNRSANQLAHGLRRFVTGAEIPVALCVERSLEMVLGLLAVLKAGGAYVPLDPSYPAERMRQILEDSRAAVVLTQQRLRSRLPESCAQLIEIDSARSCAAESSAPPPVGVDPRNLAYIIYTSGSTGRPKGVGIEHAQLVSYVMAVSERLKLEAGWSMGLVSTFAANLGYTTLYPSLCGGGVLHVLSEECGRDPRLWEQYQSQRQIECLKITPTQIRGLVEGGSGLPRKRLVLGGESCSREWVSRARDWSPGCEVVNHYGPTECTVGAVTHRIEDEVEGEVPIGKPLSNAWTYVLGSRGEVVPTGAPGELYIGGDGVGRGYLNQAQLTAERFVPDEYSGGRGRRLYRTGDLVRYRMDGNLEFIGRIDQQVKIRGFRIELGEIEAVLRQQPEVREAVVMVEESESAGKRLVAYVVGRSKSVPKNEELKSYLKTRLPDYMVPSVWVMLEEMPLMPNGKVDRRVLRVPEESEMERIVKYEPPQTPTEQMVAEIWSDLLALDTIGNQDNFFSLGGHSMLAAQMIARVRKALQIELSLVSLFEAPTVADFAAKIDAMRRAMAISSTTSAADISIRSPVTFRSRAEIE